MKTVICSLVLMLVCFSALSQTDTSLAMFRSVNISNGKRVKMQENMLELVSISKKINKYTYVLNKEAFHYVDSLGIEVDEKNKIIALTFLYGYDTSLVHEEVYFHEQKKYKKLIAAEGREFIFKSDAVSIRVNKWEDNYTIFELIEVIRNGKVKVYSRIFDKQLYYLQYKKKIDIVSKDNSIELLRILGLF